MKQLNEIQIGDKFKKKSSKLISIVTDKTSSSIELFNLKTNKNGINSKNWYAYYSDVDKKLFQEMFEEFLT